jgi:vacuole morphology and inheritance protein 14
MLLKTLSDTSEKVVIKDLQLLAQISTFSDENYFNDFMVSLLRLFSTDRKLLETRGSLMIRQMCVNLSPDVIYRSLSEVLEREEVQSQLAKLIIGSGVRFTYGSKSAQ